MRISDELLSYCHIRGAHEFHLDITEKNGMTVLSASAFPANVSDEELALLRKKLNAPRTREIEHDYWNLGGESDNTSELVLVGMMTDEATIQYKDRVLSIGLARMH
jgi:hypothetical protein